MKIAWVLCMVVACGGNDSSRHIADGNGSGSGGGSGMPEPCALTVSSTQANANATGTECGQQLVNNTTVAINFLVNIDASNTVMSEIACTILPGIVPQTMGSRGSTETGCNVEVDYSSLVNGSDEWDNSSSGTVSVTVTDLDPVGGTMNLTLFDTSNVQLTVSGTF